MSEEGAEFVARRFAAGDPAATEEVRARVGRIVAHRGYGIPTADRADLEQSVTLELWQAVARPGFDATRFWGFVEVVTSRRCIDWYRGRKPAEVLEFPAALVDPGPSPLSEALGKEQEDIAERALAVLPQACRELVELHYREHKSYAEIAAILGRSQGALRVRMHRCVKQAARILREMTAAGTVKKRGPDL